MSRRRIDDLCEYCWYCGSELLARHEHDHVPPQRHGGVQTFPACLNCHELKDRTAIDQWPPHVVIEAILSVPPGPGRVLIAKLHALALDAEAAAVTRTSGGVL